MARWRCPTPVTGCRATLNLTITPPFARWWPWELGQPQLSDLTVRFAPRDQPSRLASRVAKRVGLRTARLVTEPIAQTGGETFYFEVNGVPVYARGANVIPSDVLESRVRPSDLAALVRDARRANMNMLRVWGGGRYAQEAFYAAADAAGILVWQEFMAACAAYPRERSFLGDVALEARHQLARLGAHPSIVLWGGNNEVEASFSWSLTTMTAPQKYASDYTALFVDTLRPALLSIDSQLTFVDTSPSKGLESRDPYVKRWGDVADPSRGDVHFYDYASDALDPATYPAAKFVSEYGFMSFPSFSVYRQVSELGDWAIDAPLTDFRLRHANGVQELRAQMLRHFVSDADTPPAVTQFDGPAVVIGGPSVIVQPNASATPDQPNALQFRAFVHLSQVQQALAYETAAGVWRRGKADAEARTMGLLYWQLNDVWQGPSWSGINYGGQWKLLHHAARRFFAPVYLSAHKNRGNGTVVATVVNDLSVDVHGTLDVDVILYAARTASEGVVPVARALPVTVPALGAAVAWRDELAALSDFIVRSAAPNQLTFDSDYVVRLRFCPQSTGAVEGLPDLWSRWRADERGSSPSAESVSAFDCESEGCVGALDEAVDEARAGLEELLACSEATFFPVDFGEARLWGPPPTINATPLATDEDGSISVRLSTDTVALFVTVEPPPGVSGNFNASGVLLLPWEPQTVVFTPEAAYPEGAAVSADSASRRLAEMAPEDFAAGMYIRSLQESLLDYDLNGSVSSPTSWAGSRHSLGIAQALALAAATIVFALF
ncbi:hypothetical protein QBZ16_001678 [Prototheca wickerhamii]|uniref:Beta-mannosidase Ig-fold domain-containing protein n=1 Tax=Prototheca wickerhamii TaxID=3111 RepID=A0AAD9MIS5_PROWI|nr:hypothetical protein QBZ16_001678 [Prototheca wickerhamii]